MTFISNDINIGIDINSPISDSFGRLRTSNPVTIFNSKSVYGSGQYQFDYNYAGAGTATYVSNESVVRLDVGTSAGDKSIRQTREYFVYEPGRSQLFVITGKMDFAKTNLIQRIGAFDDNNGIFFEQNGAQLNAVLRSSTSGIFTERRVSQSDWNIDKLDGNGISEFNLDTTKANAYIIDYQWLGVGRVRLGVLSTDGSNIYCHSFKNASLFESVYMQTPNLPIRWEIINNGITTTPSSMKSICAAVFSEGGFLPIGNIVSADTGGSTFNVNIQEEVVLAVRQKNGFERATIEPQIAQALQTSADYTIYRVYVADSPTGGVWNSVSEICESNVNPGLVSSVLTGDKVQISTFYVSPQNRNSSTKLTSLLKVTSNIVGTRKALVLTAQNFAGNTRVAGSLTWKEVY